MAEIITAVILFLIAGVSFLISFRSFSEKGFLFNNAYIYASKQEREYMNKKPHYRQTAICFLLIGTFFLIDGIALLSCIDYLFAVSGLVFVALVIYAIVSSLKMQK